MIKKEFRRHKTMAIFAGGVVFLFSLFLFAIVAARVSPERQENQATASDANEPSEESVSRVTSAANEAAVLAELQDKRNESAHLGDAFADAQVSARAAIVYDINTKEVLFEKNARDAHPIASITKVMTVVTAEEFLADGSQITATPTALATQGQSELQPFEEWRFRDIVDLALITSSNDAAAVIAEAAGKEMEGEGNPTARFVDAMNQKAAEIGMSDAHFKNPTGLDEQEETEAGAVASPLDVARLFAYGLDEYPRVMTHSRFGELDFVSLNGREWHVENTNEIAETLPGLIASKTGYTLQAGGNLAVVVDVGLLKPVVIVVLGSTVDGRFSDVQELYEHMREYID